MNNDELSYYFWEETSRDFLQVIDFIDFLSEILMPIRQEVMEDVKQSLRPTPTLDPP